MIRVIKPILFRFLNTKAVKNLVIELLTAYSKRTDNKVDDYAVDLITRELFNL